MKDIHDLIHLLLDETREHQRAADCQPAEEELWHFHKKLEDVLGVAAYQITQEVTGNK